MKKGSRIPKQDTNTNIRRTRAHPMLQKNFTSTPDGFHDYLAQHTLRAYEYRVLHSLCRKTFGWGQVIKSIRPVDIAEHTGISPRHVSTTLKQLQQRGLLLREGRKMAITFPDWGIQEIPSTEDKKMHGDGVKTPSSKEQTIHEDGIRKSDFPQEEEEKSKPINKFINTDTYSVNKQEDAYEFNNHKSNETYEDLNIQAHLLPPWDWEHWEDEEKLRALRYAIIEVAKEKNPGTIKTIRAWAEDDRNIADQKEFIEHSLSSVIKVIALGWERGGLYAVPSILLSNLRNGRNTDNGMALQKVSQLFETFHLEVLQESS